MLAQAFIAIAPSDAVFGSREGSEPGLKALHLWVEMTSSIQIIAAKHHLRHFAVAYFIAACFDC